MLKPTVEIACANGNLADLSSFKAKVGSLWRSRDELGEFADATGYVGYEIHPVRDRFLASVLGRGAIAAFLQLPCDDELVVSTHQSFTDSRSPLVERLAMPPEMSSLKTLRRLERAVGRPLDMVVYPEALAPGEKFTDQNSTSARRGAQPRPELWRRFGITSPDHEMQVLSEAGVTHLLPDTFHDRQDAVDAPGLYLPGWEGRWPKMAAAGQVYEVHFAVGRTDMAENGSQISPEHFAITNKELQAAIADEPEPLTRTEAWDMLLSVVESTSEPELRIVTEVPLAAIVAQSMGYLAAHAHMVNNLAVNLAPYATVTTRQ